MNKIVHNTANSPTYCSNFSPLTTNKTFQQKKILPKIGKRSLRSRFNTFVKENSRNKADMKFMPQSKNKKLFDALQKNVHGKLAAFPKGLRQNFNRKLSKNHNIFENPYFLTVLRAKMKS